MKLISINQSNYGSTGNIMIKISNLAENHGFATKIAVPADSIIEKEMPPYIKIGSRFSRKLHRNLGYYSGLSGLFSVFPTINFCKKLNKEKPDIIHLHNLHGDYINFPILFHYIKKHNIAVVWTLHDCCSFTGQCSHFSRLNCEKWKYGCHNCRKIDEYPRSKIDNTKIMWKIKKHYFSNVPNMTIVTPSQWLANLVKLSYLKEYPIKVINNGINTDIFKPRINNFRIKHGIKQSQSIILGVSLFWNYQKGIDIFLSLCKKLDPEKFKIVMVGTDDDLDKYLPSNIISIHKTNNQLELAEIYSAADVLINPTREENYPTVNLEAIACGTPVVTFDTGGCSETIDGTVGVCVPFDDVDTMEKEIIRICSNNPFSKDVFFNKAEKSNENIKFMEYINLFKSISNNNTFIKIRRN